MKSILIREYSTSVCCLQIDLDVVLVLSIFECVIREIKYSHSFFLITHPTAFKSISSSMILYPLSIFQILLEFTHVRWPIYIHLFSSTIFFIIPPFSLIRFTIRIYQFALALSHPVGPVTFVFIFVFECIDSETWVIVLVKVTLITVTIRKYYSASTML